MTAQEPHPARGSVQAGLALALLAAGYALAFGLDTWLSKLKDAAQISFDFTPLVLLSAAAPLAVAAAVLALAWLAFRQPPPRLFTGLTYTLSGLFVLGEFLSIFFSVPLWLRDTAVGRFRFALMNFGTESATCYFAGGILVVGLAALIRRGKAAPDPTLDVRAGRPPQHDPGSQ